MEVQTFDDAGAFRQAADPLLVPEEAVNNLILGVTGTALEHPGTFEHFAAWVVLDSGAPVVAAARTPPNNLILAASRRPDAVRALAADVGDLPGIVGVVPSVEHFVDARPEDSRRSMSQGIFQLEAVTTPTRAEGLSRQAEPDEIEALVQMRLAFEKEAIGRVDDPAMARRGTEWRIKEQSPRFGLWVHEVAGRVVSISGHSGPTPNGIRIGPVYTPPEHRGHGYASTLVAAESQWLLDHGHSYCFLYTDLGNATSNSIYQRIGYRQIAESAEYTFNPRP